MTPEKQRVAIAKVCGKDVSKRVSWRSEWEGIPNYLGDLNAMASAESLLDDPTWTLPGTIIRGSLSLFDSYADQLRDRFGRSIRASASQRAEAFLRTIGKWEE